MSELMRAGAITLGFMVVLTGALSLIVAFPVIGIPVALLTAGGAFVWARRAGLL